MIILSLTILIKCSSLLAVGKAHEAVTSLFLGPFMLFACKLQAPFAGANCTVQRAEWCSQTLFD